MPDAGYASRKPYSYLRLLAGLVLIAVTICILNFFILPGIKGNLNQHLTS